jgi:spore germination protein GerM
MKRSLLLLLVTVILFVAIGVFAGIKMLKDQPADPGKEPPETQKPGEPEGPGNGAEGENQSGAENRTVRIELYFSDNAAVARNEPGETGFMKKVTREFPHTLGVLRLSLEELIRGPLPGEGDLAPTLPATTRILDLRIKDRVAIVDLSPAVLTDPGSPQGSFAGALFIRSLVLTATQFPTVDAVLVKVNGEPWCDGHFTWEHPLGRADLGL